MRHSTYQKLVLAASRLFGERGYASTGVADILERANVPKGSLYYHFPGGKHDLAIAAAQWSSEQVIEIIDDIFLSMRHQERDFVDGAREICLRAADMFEYRLTRNFSSVASILLDDVDNDKFRCTANEIFEEWKLAFVRHGAYFNVSEHSARTLANQLLTLLEGGWVLARAKGSADPIREVVFYLNDVPCAHSDDAKPQEADLYCACGAKRPRPVIQDGAGI